MRLANYDQSTGRIMFIVECGDLQVEHQRNAVPCPTGDSTTHYVLSGAPVERPACPAVLNGKVLSGLPVPCKLVIHTGDYVMGRIGTEYHVFEPTVELAFPNPGAYTAVVECFPYLDGIYKVNV